MMRNIILTLGVLFNCSILFARRIDVVIPCHPKDVHTLNVCIDGLRSYVEGVERIIIVSKQRLTDQAEWFDEALFPFSEYDLALEIFGGNQHAALQFINHPKTRIGWIKKQIMNLHIFDVIPNLSDDVLVIDSDSILLKPVTFFDSEGHALYNPGDENHRPYFDHGKRLIPGFVKVFPQYSGISHHLLFQRKWMEEIHQVIHKAHNTETWRAICRCIDRRELFGSCMAEYELYFNYVFLKHPEAVRLRHLKWDNINNLDFARYKRMGYDYVSAHTWMR